MTECTDSCKQGRPTGGYSRARLQTPSPACHSHTNANVTPSHHRRHASHRPKGRKSAAILSRKKHSEKAEDFKSP